MWCSTVPHTPKRRGSQCAFIPILDAVVSANEKNSFKLKRDANTLYNFINSIGRHHPLEIFTLTASVVFSSPFKSSSTKTLKGKGKKSTEQIYNLGNSVESITALVQFIQRRLCVTISRLIFLFNTSICTLLYSEKQFLFRFNFNHRETIEIIVHQWNL